MRIVIMGPPGVGKGTQAALLSDRLDIPAISTGDLFRAHVRDQTILGLELQDLVAAGHYVPDETTNDVVEERLARPDAQHGFILDGYPRTQAQARVLDGLLGRAGRELDAVVLLEADVDEIAGRLTARAISQGRADDTPEVIARRFAIYESETAAVVDGYEKRGLLHRIRASGDPHQVAELLRRTVGSLEAS